MADRTSVNNALQKLEKLLTNEEQRTLLSALVEQFEDYAYARYEAGLHDGDQIGYDSACLRHGLERDL